MPFTTIAIRRYIWGLGLLLAVLTILPNSWLAQLEAQGIKGGPQPVQLHTLWDTQDNQAHPGDGRVMAIQLQIPAQLHINPDQAQIPPDQKYLIPTQITVDQSGKNLVVGQPQFPKATPITVGYTGQPEQIPAFAGQITLFLPVVVKPDAPPGEQTVELSVTWQACDDQTCFMPETRKLAATLRVVPRDVPIAVQPGSTFTAFDAKVFPTLHQQAMGRGEMSNVQGPKSKVLEEIPGGVGFDFFGWRFEVRSTPVIWLIAMVVGILLNFTPCVLPVVPLKIMSLQQHAGHAGKRLAFGLSFGLGIVFTFAVLGLLVAGAVGAVGRLNWGEQFGYWWFNLILAAIVLAMALGMMGLFTTRLPSFVYNFTPRQDTHTGNFLFGILTAVLSTPCTAPMMAGTLTWAAGQPAWMGLSAFISMGVGMALPYLLLVAYPAWLNRLPRTGPGSELIKQIMAGLLLAVTAYLVGIAGYPWWGSRFWWAVAGIVMLTMIWMVAKTFIITRRIGVRFSITILALALSLASLAAAQSLARTSLWQAYSPATLENGLRQKRIVVLEFTADWCFNCKALEAAVLHDPQIIERLSRPDVLALRVDLTSKTNVEGWTQLTRLGFTGIPLTAIYRPGHDQPRLLASFYTKAALLEAIDGP